MKIDTKTIHRIDYSDFEALVNDSKTYGFEQNVIKLGDGHEMRQNAYSFVADVECGNDTSHEYDGITKANAIKEFEHEGEDFEEWKASNAQNQLWGANLILLDLVQRDLIPEGDYVISVCW